MTTEVNNSAIFCWEILFFMWMVNSSHCTFHKLCLNSCLVHTYTVPVQCYSVL